MQKTVASRLGVQQTSHHHLLAQDHAARVAADRDRDREFERLLQREAAERRLSEREEAARWEETRRIIEEEKRRDLERLQAQLDQAVAATAGHARAQAEAQHQQQLAAFVTSTPLSSPRRAPSIRSLGRERFTLFGRGRKEERTQAPVAQGHAIAGKMTSNSSTTTTSPPKERTFIEAGGGGRRSAD